jgi:hypothetical protein
MTTRQLLFVRSTETSSQKTFDFMVSEGTIAESTSTLRVVETESSDVNVEINGQLIADKIRGRSDEKLKSNINNIKNALQTLKTLNGKSYYYKKSTQISYGLIAQEVETILPEIVETDEDDIRSISYTDIIAFLIEAIKELDDKIEGLRNINKF